MRPVKKTYPPCTDCLYLTPKPNAKGYICGALTELLCVTKGSCKFIKREEGKHGK